MISKSVVTDFSPEAVYPTLDPTAYVHPMGVCIGAVSLGARTFIAPLGAVRGDEGQPIHIGSDTNVQECCVVHGLETQLNGVVIEGNCVTGEDGEKYSVWIGDRVSMGHQSQIHGPAKVGNDVFVGMGALIFKGEVGNNCVVEPGAKVMGGAVVADGRYVPTNFICNTQELADALPKITEDYAFKDLNAAVVHVNSSFAVGYAREQPLDK